MKKTILFLFISFLAATSNLQAQSWESLSSEQKMMKAKEFRADNQQYLKSIGVTDDQMSDVDDVNICFLSTLDRIDRYGGDEANKKKYAKSALKSRSAQLDAILGEDKRKQYMTYVQDKLAKVMPAQ